MSMLARSLTLAPFYLLAASFVCPLVAQQDANTAPTVLAQDKKPSGMKVIEISHHARTEPVRILNFRVGKERVKPAYYNGEDRPFDGTPFQSDENWLANLSFTLRNRTSETITHLILVVGFPETKTRDAEEVWAYIEFLTRHPAESTSDDSETPRDVPFKFAPSSEFRVSLEDYIGLLRQRVEERRPLASINRVMIVIHYIRFEDGPLTWSTSNGYCAEPPNIRGGGCSRLEETYFPGILPPISSEGDQ